MTTATRLPNHHAAYTAPAKRFSADGRHIGPGPWLDLIHAANGIAPGLFGTPDSEMVGKRWVEDYDGEFTVEWDLDEHGDAASDVTVTAMTADAGEILDRAAEITEGVTRMPRVEGGDSRVILCHFCAAEIVPSTSADDRSEWLPVEADADRLCREAPASILYHRPWEPTRLPEHLTPAVEGRIVETPTAARTLHLGIVALDRQNPPTEPDAFAFHITAQRGTDLVDVPVLVVAGSDSFVEWGNTSDPDSHVVEDGTRHIEITFFEGQSPADWNAEREWGLAVHARLTTFLAANAPGWRPADYVVWSDSEAHSEDSRTDVCL